MKTTQEINKTLYQSPTDYPEMSGGGDIIEDTLNILGDNISTEAQDVVMGGPSIKPPVTGVCCREVNGCTRDCTSDTCVNNFTVSDISCPKDRVCLSLSGDC